MMKRNWNAQETFVRCKSCGKGKPRSAYIYGYAKVCKECRNKNKGKAK